MGVGGVMGRKLFLNLKKKKRKMVIGYLRKFHIDFIYFFLLQVSQFVMNERHQTSKTSNKAPALLWFLNTSSTTFCVGDLGRSFKPFARWKEHESLLLWSTEVVQVRLLEQWAAHSKHSSLLILFNLSWDYFSFHGIHTATDSLVLYPGKTVLLPEWYSFRDSPEEPHILIPGAHLCTKGL